MKKRYGISMKTYGVILPKTKALDRLTVLSKPAKQRLKWMDYYYAHNCNARLTCRHFGISASLLMSSIAGSADIIPGISRLSKMTRLPERQLSYVSPRPIPGWCSGSKSCAKNIPAGARKSSGSYSRGKVTIRQFQRLDEPWTDCGPKAG